MPPFGDGVELFPWVWLLSDLVQRREVTAARWVKPLCFIAVIVWQSDWAPYAVDGVILHPSLFVTPDTSHPQNKPPSPLLFLSYSFSLLFCVTAAPTHWLVHLLWKGERRKQKYQSKDTSHSNTELTRNWKILYVLRVDHLNIAYQQKLC